MERIRAVIHPSREQVRIRVNKGADEILKAVLPSTRQQRAVPTLLEAQSLWSGRRVSVVLFVDDPVDGCALGLCDDFGCGHETAHYEVEVVPRGRRGRRLRLTPTEPIDDRQLLFWRRS